jgi:hypothetical protein
MSLIKIKILRPVFIEGANVDAGKVVQLDPCAAWDVTATGRAVFVDLDDRAVAVAAVRERDAGLQSGVRDRSKSWVRNW